MNNTLLALLVVVLAVALWRRFANGAARPTRKRDTSPAVRTDPRYRCVSVDTGLSACRAAQRLGGRRFLPQDAPTLPLPACDEKRCACRYAHHADRRDDDRRDPYSRIGIMTQERLQERRRGWDRRRPVTD
jgi:hypothetical protein